MGPGTRFLTAKASFSLFGLHGDASFFSPSFFGLHLQASTKISELQSLCAWQVIGFEEVIDGNVLPGMDRQLRPQEDLKSQLQVRAADSRSGC